MAAHKKDEALKTLESLPAPKAYRFLQKRGRLVDRRKQCAGSGVR